MRIFPTLIVALTVSAPVAHAQTYPDYSEIYINDYADLLTEEEEDDIRSDLKRLRSDAGVEFTVVTINTMQDFGHNGAIEPFATGLFNHWGVGRCHAERWRDDADRALRPENADRGWFWLWAQ